MSSYVEFCLLSYVRVSVKPLYFLLKWDREANAIVLTKIPPFVLS